MSTVVTKNLIAMLEDSSAVATIYVRGRLTQELFSASQEWLVDLIDQVGIEHVRGVLLDVRRVDVFERFNPAGRVVEALPYALLAHLHQTPVVSFYEGTLPQISVVTAKKQALHNFQEWHLQHRRIYTLSHTLRDISPTIRYASAGGS